MPLDRLLRLQVCHRILDEVAAICGSAAVFDGDNVLRQRFAHDAFPECLGQEDPPGRSGRCLASAAQAEGWTGCAAGRGEHRVLWLKAGASRIGSVLCGALQRALCRSEELYHLERLLALLAAEVDSFSTLASEAATSTPPVPFPELLGDSPVIQAVRAEIRRAIAVSSPVLIQGEAGTGKDLVAWLIHDGGPNRSGPYLTRSCAGMSEEAMASALFGEGPAPPSGAGDGRAGLLAAARGGTLLLDDVGELGVAAQSRLLEALESGAVTATGKRQPLSAHLRLLAATKVDLQAEVRAGRFQRDLRDRLGEMEIRMPALRERPEDVPLLAAHALGNTCARLRIPVRCFSRDAMAALVAAQWPGNIRQLIHEIECAAVASDEPMITLERLSVEVRKTRLGGDHSFLSLRQRVIDAWERAEILGGLERTHWNVAALAKELGMSKRALFVRLARLGLKRPTSVPRGAGAHGRGRLKP